MLRSHACNLYVAQAVTSIHGVVTGRISLEHKGAYTVRCCATGLTAAMKLHASTMLTPKARMHEARPSTLQCLLAQTAAPNHRHG